MYINAKHLLMARLHHQHIQIRLKMQSTQFGHTLHFTAYLWQSAQHKEIVFICLQHPEVLVNISQRPEPTPCGWEILHTISVQ